MTKGSKVFIPGDVPESNAFGYPEPFREGQRKRYNRRLGDHAGLKNYGVNLIRVLPGGQSSARHAHSKQDEFVYVLEGEFVLVTDTDRRTWHMHWLSGRHRRRTSLLEPFRKRGILPGYRRPHRR
ncbi:MAG: cupin domain-containing protein [Geminicoccales bacterium]